jgi:hypothetical protein
VELVRRRNTRTAEEIRGEIRSERAILERSLTELRADVKRSGRLGGSAAAALTTVLLFRRLQRRRHG